MGDCSGELPICSFLMFSIRMSWSTCSLVASGSRMTGLVAFFDCCGCLTWVEAGAGSSTPPLTELEG